MKQDNKIKELSKITYDMSDKDRANYLRNKVIKIVLNDSSKFELAKYQHLLSKITNKTLLKKELRFTGENIGVFCKYSSIGDTPLVAYFSKNNLFESISKISDYIGMYYVIFNIENILINSIKIEEHTDNKCDRNNKLIHELLALLECGNDNILVIKITVKEQIKQDNNLYSISNLETIKKRDGHPQMFDRNRTLETGHPSLSITIAQLMSYVNNESILRYIPNDLLNDYQIQIKIEAINKYKEIKKIQIERKQNKLKDK